MNGTYSTSSVGQQTGPKVIDDFLRRELRVGDPRNALEVVAALRQRYANDAARIDSEAAGLPYRYEQMPSAYFAPRGTADTPGSKEERRVQTDLDSDLAALIDSRDNREWAPEFRGWRDVLVREFADGTAAARMAADPAMRDRGFLAVRKLGEYARVARLVGVLNLVLNEDFRRLSTTLDDAANVIRILMGEALFDSGLADGGQVIQVSVVDMRQRRDSVMVALRRLAGLNDTGFDGDWGDDVAAYGELLDEIDDRSAPELNVYLREEMLGPILDGLVGSVSRQDPESLRQIAATAPVEIARIKRLLDIVAAQLRAATAEVSAGLTAFAESLRLFVEAFDQDRAGARLIDLSVPLPMAAQQSGEGDADGRRVLLELVIARGQYSQEVDCFLSCCGGTSSQLRTQVRLDRFLYDLDRAVDLYSRGSQKSGPEEQRASVYKIIAERLLDDPNVKPLPGLVATLNKLAAALGEGGPAPDEVKRQVLQEICVEESDWEVLVRSLVPNCLGTSRIDPFTTARDLLQSIIVNSTCEHTSDFVRPASVRVSLQRLADHKQGGSYGSAPALPPVPAPQKPTPDVAKFFKQLSNFKDADDLFHNAAKASTRDQWGNLKARADLYAMLRQDEVRAIDELMSCTDPKQIDVNKVRDVCNQVLSR